MKKITILLFIISVSLLLTGCFFNKNNKDALKFKEEYESLNGKKSSSGKTYPKLEISKDNPIKYKTEEELVKIIKDGTGVIYFGFPNCPWCRSALPSLFKAAEEADIGDIYYLNVKDIRDVKEVDSNGKIITKREGTNGYNELLKVLNDYLDDYTVEDSNGNKINTNEKRIYVPLVVFVRDGKILGIHVDTVSSQKNPYDGLNKEQTEELTLIYYKLMLKVSDDACDESC